MRDQDEGARVAAQVLLKPVTRFKIEVIRRLVQQQQRRLFKQQLCERDAHLPSTAELIGLPRPVFLAEAEAAQHRAHLRIQVVEVMLLQRVAHQAEAIRNDGVLRTCRVEVREFVAQVVHLAVHRQRLVKDRQALLEDGLAAHDQTVLRQVADGHSLAAVQLAAVKLLNAREHLQQRALAGAVTAHQAGALVRRDQPVGAFKQQFVSEALGSIGEVQHGSIFALRGRTSKVEEMRRPSSTLALLWILCLLSVVSRAQTLAHPGWRGNGIDAEAWWKHADFVRYPADATFESVAKSLNRISEVGADSFILPDLQAPGAAVQTAASAVPYTARFGTEDDLDALLRETSARRMHVLVELPLARVSGGSGEARFWLSRGVAGFDVGAVAATDTAALRSLTALSGQFAGRHVVLAHVAAGSGVAPGSGNTVLIVTETAEEVEAQPATSRNANVPHAVEIAAAPGSETSADAASLPHLLPLLLSDSRMILDSRLIESDSSLDQLRRVLALRSSNAVLRDVRAVPLNATGMRAWMLHDAHGSQSELLLLWNNSDSDTALAPALAATRVNAAYITPILRSDGHAGPLKVATDKLPAHAVVLGSLFGLRPRR